MVALRSVLSLLIYIVVLTWELNAAATFKIAKMDSPDHILIMHTIKRAYQQLNIDVRFIEFPGR